MCVYTTFLRQRQQRPHVTVCVTRGILTAVYEVENFFYLKRSRHSVALAFSTVATVFAICDHVRVLCFIRFIPYLLFLSVLFLSNSEGQSILLNLLICHRSFSDPKTRIRKTVLMEHNASNNCFAV